MDKTIEKFNKMKLNMMLSSPFFGNLLVHLPIVVDDKIKSFTTDGKKFIINEKYANTLNERECSFALLHVLFHIILGHLKRALNYKNDAIFHLACDIVVNANIKNLFYEFEELDFGIEIKDAHKFTAEQVYNILKNGNIEYKKIDSHSEWFSNDNSYQTAEENETIFNNYIKEEMKNEEVYSKLPESFRKLLHESISEQINWKSVLYDFIEEDICDYSFFSKDNRYIESEIFVPSFSEKIDSLNNIYFFIDSSASMSDEAILDYISEIKKCLYTFEDAINAYICFFDYTVSSKEKIHDFKIESFQKLKKGTGTSFINIFKFLNNVDNEEIDKVVILTDGEAIIPDKELMKKYKCLWVINNKNFYSDDINFVHYNNNT